MVHRQSSSSYYYRSPSVVCLLRLTTEDVRGDWLRFAPTEGSVAYGYRPRPSVLLPATYSSCTVEKKGGGSRTAHSAEVGTDEMKPPGSTPLLLILGTAHGLLALAHFS
nr:unnamed protein product [Digitaria exilis]